MNLCRALLCLIILSLALITNSAAIVIKDIAGRTVILNETPERVIVITSYWAEIIDLLGEGDRIVGIGKYIPYSDYISKDIKSKTIVGDLFSGLEWETIASLNPDLIISDYGWGTWEETIQKAEELDIPIIALAATNISTNLECIRILGEVFGKEQKAQEIIDFIESKLDKIEEISKTVPKKNVLVISYDPTKPEPIKVYAEGSAWASIPEIVGAHNLAFDMEFSTPWPSVDLEDVIAWWSNADVLIVLRFLDKTELDELIEQIKSDERWQEIKAVKEGNVYGIPCGNKLGHFLDWGPRIIVGIYQFADAIYPKYYPRWEKIANELLQKFYEMSYEYDPWIDYDLKKPFSKIDDNELINAIIDWLNNKISDSALINVIVKWLSS